MSSLDINGNLFLLIRNMTRMDGQSSGGKNMISFLTDMVLRRGGERERRKTKKKNGEDADREKGTQRQS